MSRCPTAFGGIGEKLSAAERVAGAVSAELTARGAVHAIVGGLAVAAHGYGRSTDDVDVLVLDRDKVRGHPIGIPGVGFTRDGVGVDALFLTLPAEKFMVRAVRGAALYDGIPVLPYPALVYLKLKANRAKDRADVVELAKVNMALAAPTIAWLASNAPPGYADRFAALAAEAARESE